MKFTVIIDEDREEEIIVYAKKESRFIAELESFIKSNTSEFLGYGEGSAVKLSPAEV